MTLDIKTTTDFNQSKQTIINIIRDSINDFDIHLSENSLNNLVVHLTITIIRLQSDNYIPLSKSQITTIKDDSNYPYALELCSKLSKQFNIDFPENEVSLVAIYLSKNQLLDIQINSGFDLIDKDIFNILRETMHNINKEYQQDFRYNDDPFIAIGLHLAPAIERLQHGQLLDNPLTKQIIKEHPVAFKYTKELNKVILDTYNNSFNDDELAFIALHFATIINKNNIN